MITLKQLTVVLTLLLLASCGNQENKNSNENVSTESQKITIATAANMQFAINELSKIFTKQTDIECEIVISSSGKLTAQIKEGAPYNVFVAANMKYPQEIYNSKLTENKPTVYAYGKLVLWSMVEGIEPSLALLEDNSIQHIALANPKTAPYGVAAMEVLNHQSIYDKVEDKLVFGENVSQTNQFITSKSAEIGFTALSVVLSPEMKGKGKWIALEDTIYSPIEQGVVVIKHNNQYNEAAMAFYDFLFSKNAQEILTNFGYAVNE